MARMGISGNPGIKTNNLNFAMWCTDENGYEDVDALDRVHDEDYLNIAEFNAMYWEGI